ncbi:MAG TPA: trigger factor [Acidimicrobiales bacterium]|jgi:trigger factor
MRATAEPIEGNRVRLSVEVDEPEVDRALNDMVRTLSRQVRVPGFRPGKVPRRVLEARMGGATALRAEALRESLPEFYARAVSDADVDPIAPPDIDITSGEESGAVAFDAVVQVRPLVAVPGHEGLVVTVPGLTVSDEEVDAQVDRLRENDGELIDVSRPAIDDDQVTIDVTGTGPGGEEVLAVTDYLYSVGSGTIVPELDEQLRGTGAGGILAFTATPEQGEEEIAFRVLVKEVKQKKLPVPTDEWAAEASEFDTLAELRDDLRQRLARMRVVQAQLSLRENAVAALVELVDDGEVPDPMVDEELNQRLHDLGHRLEEQRISLDQLLAATGRTQESLLDELRGEAHRAVKTDLALRAVAEAQGIAVDDDELGHEIEAMAERMGSTPAVLRAELERAGRTAAVRSEQRKAKALAWLIEHVDLVDDEGNPVDREALRIDQGVDDEAIDDEGDGADGEGGAEPEVSAGARAGAEDIEGTEDEDVPPGAEGPAGPAGIDVGAQAAVGATNEETTEP